jgi:hypothetical protein
LLLDIAGALHHRVLPVIRQVEPEDVVERRKSAVEHVAREGGLYLLARRDLRTPAHGRP